MRILHVYKTYYPYTTGGIEKVLWQLMSGLTAEGVENRLLVLSPSPHLEIVNRDECQLWRYGSDVEIASSPMSWKAMAAFKQHVSWADIVHYQFPWPFGDLLYLLKGQGKPSVVTYHSDIVRQKKLMWLYRPLMRRFLGSVDRIYATSPDYLNTSQVLRTIGRKVEVIPNGLDEDSCKPASRGTFQKWQERFGEGFFLFVGVLRYYKGLHTLIQAASKISAPIVIAGDGPEHFNLRSMAAGLSNVHFLGHITDEDKAALLQLSGALVFPSHLRSEAFGMSLVEASIYGKPMITCEIGTGTSFVNIDGVTGYVIPPERPNALASAMHRLWCDPRLRAAMGQEANQRYKELFTGQRMALTYYNVYRELVTK